MKPLLHARSLNGMDGDPVVHVRFMFERRGLLFDLGDISTLSMRDILGLQDIFVSHMHMDHFADFDRLLRAVLGRDMTLRVVGPEGFIDRLGHRLASYSWNLVERFTTDVCFQATEVISSTQGRRARFRLSRRFAREDVGAVALSDGIVLDEPMIWVRAAVLDHGIPCLGFALEERGHINVWRNRVEDMGLVVGPWLRDLKRAVLEGQPDNTPIAVAWREKTQEAPVELPLGTLKERVLSTTEGQKVAYVVDTAYTGRNKHRIVDLARDADILFIETAFSHNDRAAAADRKHLTAVQAGHMARLAGVQRVEALHISPRYADEPERLERELADAFEGRRDAEDPTD
ncbi:ribonuclease Z [Ferruginivarius sediminum]|uniref:Ribonuclease Z n=1 Tax=Ferruginivarius sediminum TaxID=2661937 RepID=A0A369T8K0_9PROT|nr:ribonuclease Z [Ferruginivarius sediminum]RDD60794.1 ribonuclease Z [Ferruginivarius sediminum]